MCISFPSDYLLLVSAARICGDGCAHTHTDPAGKQNFHFMGWRSISAVLFYVFKRNNPCSNHTLYIWCFFRLLWMLGIKSHGLWVHVSGLAPSKFRLSLTSCWGSPQRSCLSGRQSVCVLTRVVMATTDHIGVF